MTCLCMHRTCQGERRDPARAAAHHANSTARCNTGGISLHILCCGSGVSQGDVSECPLLIRGTDHGIDCSIDCNMGYLVDMTAIVFSIDVPGGTRIAHATWALLQYADRKM